MEISVSDASSLRRSTERFDMNHTYAFLFLPACPVYYLNHYHCHYHYLYHYHYRVFWVRLGYVGLCSVCLGYFGFAWVILGYVGFLWVCLGFYLLWGRYNRGHRVGTEYRPYTEQ